VPWQATREKFPDTAPAIEATCDDQSRYRWTEWVDSSAGVYEVCLAEKIRVPRQKESQREEHGE
jgi:hypothetical protein